MPSSPHIVSAIAQSQAVAPWRTGARHREPSRYVRPDDRKHLQQVHRRPFRPVDPRRPARSYGRATRRQRPRAGALIMAHKPKTEPKAKQPELPLDDRRWLLWRRTQAARASHRRSGSRFDRSHRGKCARARSGSHAGTYAVASASMLPTYFAELCMVGGEIVRRFDFEKRRDWASMSRGPRHHEALAGTEAGSR